MSTSPADAAGVATDVGCSLGERRCDLNDQILACSLQGWSVEQQCADGCADGACVCVPRCVAGTCGADDGCGGTCGCATGVCRDGECGPRCPPEGTGRAVGQQLAAIALSGPEGTWRSADRCGVGLTLVVEAAVWCESCGPSVVHAHALVGDDLVVALGEALPNTAATSQDALNYAATYGVPAGAVVLDSLFSTLGVAVDHGGGGFPFFLLLDADRRIRYAGSGGVAGEPPSYPELDAAVQAALAEGPQPGDAAPR